MCAAVCPCTCSHGGYGELGLGAKTLLDRNLLMCLTQCGHCIPFLLWNCNITEMLCWRSCGQSSNGGVRELGMYELVEPSSPLMERLLYSVFWPSLWGNSQINAQRMTGQQNCCCLRRIFTLHFLPLRAVHVSDFHRDSFTHLLTPQVAVCHFRVIFLYMQRRDLINIKQCPGTVVPRVLVR